MDELTVAAVMTVRVWAAGPATSCRELAAMLTEHAISAVPVLDRHGRPIGVVSEADLITRQEFAGTPEPHGDRAARDRWFRAQGRNAAEVMSTPVRAVQADEPVGFAAGVLAKTGLRRLFVVDRDGRLVGVVSRRDLLRIHTAPRTEERSTR